MRFPSLSLLGAALALSLAACSSLTPPPTVDEDSRNQWVLAQEKDAPHAVTLVRGMSPETVASLLGKPHHTRTPKKAERPTEEWTYRRRVLGGHFMSSALSKDHGYVTADQRVVYLETLELTFVDRALAKVQTSRYREDSDVGSPASRL